MHTIDFHQAGANLHTQLVQYKYQASKYQASTNYLHTQYLLIYSVVVMESNK